MLSLIAAEAVEGAMKTKTSWNLKENCFIPITMIPMLTPLKYNYVFIFEKDQPVAINFFCEKITCVIKQHLIVTTWSLEQK